MECTLILVSDSEDRYPRRELNWRGESIRSGIRFCDCSRDRFFDIQQSLMLIELNKVRVRVLCSVCVCVYW